MARVYLQDRQVTPQQGQYVPTKKTYLKDRTASGIPMVKPLSPTKLAAKEKRFTKNLSNAQAGANYYKQQADQAGSLMGLIKNTFTGIPKAVGTIGQEAITHPINTVRSIASGVYEGAVKPIAKLPTYFAGQQGQQARTYLDQAGNAIAGNQNQTQQDIRSGFKFGGAVAPYELAGSLASRILPKAAAGIAGYVGGGQLAYEGNNTVQDRGKQALLDSLLFGLTKVAGKGLSTLKKPIAEAVPYTTPINGNTFDAKKISAIADNSFLNQPAKRFDKPNRLQGDNLSYQEAQTGLVNGENIKNRIVLATDDTGKVNIEDGRHLLEAYREKGIPVPKDKVQFADANARKVFESQSPLLQEAGRIPTNDVHNIQEIRNSINEGKTILRSGSINGRKLSQEELSQVARSVDNAQAKIGVEAKDGYKVQEISSDTIFGNATRGVGKSDLTKEGFRKWNVLVKSGKAEIRDGKFYKTDLYNKAQGGVKSLGSESIPKLPEAAKTPLERVSQKSAEVSKKVGQDVSLPSIVQQSSTDVKNKVNILDALRTPDRVLKKIGLEKESNLIRTQHEKYLTELPKQIEKIDVWAKQLNPESNQKVFRFLDGEKIPLTPQEGKIAGEIKTYLKDWADRLGLPEDKRITNYITHIFDKDLIQKEFPDELAKIIDTKVAGSVYDPFMLKRLGKLGYVPDVVRALDAYAKRATRKVHMDVALEQMSKASKNLEISQFKYVKEYIDRVNLRPTELDNAVDNTIKSMVGYKLGARPTASLTQSARQWIYRGTLGLNPGSALKNLSQGANTYAKLGEKYTATGYINLIKNWKSGELEKVGVLQDSFIQDRGLSAGKKLLQRFDDGLMTFFQGAEKINRGAAYYGAKAKGLNEGLSEPQAIEYAKKIVRDTQFTFGSIDTPPILQSDIGKTLGQFQSFTIKQGEFLGEMAAAKDIAGLIRYALASTAYITAIGSAFGMKPSDAIPSFRFGVPPTVAPIVEGTKTLLGAPNKYGQPTGWKDLSKTLIPLIPAGTQLNKSIGGVQSYNQGMVTNGSGNAQYPIEQNVPNFLRTLLFGKYNTPEGRQYFNNNERPLSPAQTQLLKELGPTYYEELMRTRDALAEKEKLKKFQKTNQPFYTR